MNSAIPAIAVVSALVIVIQLVILARIGKAKKEILAALTKIGEQTNRRPPQRNDIGRRRRTEPGRDQGRDRNQERNRDNRPRVSAAPTAPVAAVPAGVDSSLREINLKLKNAEKSQENARRQVREFSSDTDSQERNRSSRRRGRSRRPRQDRERGDSPSRSKHSQNTSSTDTSPIEFAPMESRDTDFDSAESKVAVKRRVLEGTEEFGNAKVRTSFEAAAVAPVAVEERREEPVARPVETSAPRESESQPVADAADGNDAKTGISFGRR